MQIIMLGSPGAGKGTQGKLLAKRFNIPQISTGDMLRTAIAAASPLGLVVKEIMDSGQLVPDEVMIKLVKNRLHEKDCEGGYILDGFPRTVAQADALRQEGVPISYVIEIAADEEEVIKRLSGRWTHPGSGRVYHTLNNPPKVPGKDDVTGEDLMQRVDDHEETVRHRLAVYHRQTEPLIAYYHQNFPDQESAPVYIRVNGTEPMEKVQEAIVSQLVGEKI